MKTFKSIMRGIVSTILFVVIFFGLLIWTGEGLLGIDNFFTTFVWITGALVMSVIIWLFWITFIIWLTDGKWELEEESEKSK